ncbi:serine/threonine-protein kinase [Maridesulfovibrio sp.]|uniref:serine/threonine-protein kinase n=1 Tax=Maridesulfovibrio sp. TaxID=2795000 RepID=UPI0029F4FFAB|nr:serine/threonine-protein kinase [Maridesulfovibrio sp.]
MSKRLLSPKDQIYKYTLIKKLGQGGFGQVWLAKDAAVDRVLAVKIIESSGNIISALKEARIGNKLSHDNLSRIHYADVVKENDIDLVIIAMDHYERGDISQLANTDNFIPIKQTIRVIIDVLKGLDHLHRQNLYHCDIKPNNILINDNGSGILTDYGISCPSSNGESVCPESVYVLHMSPEVLKDNKINAQTDIYQLGLTAFRMLTDLKFLENKDNLLGRSTYYEKIKSGTIISNSDYLDFIPRQLKAIINKALKKEPSQRYGSAIEMRRALESLRLIGTWTVDNSNNYLGEDKSYYYRFEISPRRAGNIDFTAFKTNKSSGKETRVTKYCGKNISKRKGDTLRKQFMQYVVCG